MLTGLGSTLSPPLCSLGSHWPSLSHLLTSKAEVAITCAWRRCVEALALWPAASMAGLGVLVLESRRSEGTGV